MLLLCLHITNLLGYVLFLAISLFLMCAVPLLIYQCRRPHWKTTGRYES